MTTKILQGHVLDILKDMSTESIDLIIFSPPYYGTRDYGEKAITVWRGKPECKHEWKDNFCECGAWRGQLGMEPDYMMYIDNMVEVFKELKRVLKKTGSIYMVIDDVYASKSMNWTEEYANKKQYHPKEPLKRGTGNIQGKSLMLIPERLAIRL
ncbi:MAG: DNA methyltransferase, partial [Fervidobacterium sp.]